MKRTVKQIYSSKKVNMGGIIIDQPLPQAGINDVNPFILIHHWEGKYNGGEQQQDVGVPPHPHRGFSPVTFIFKGGVHHRDSLGNDGVIYAGGAQWINSGKGIVHSERPAKEIAESGGEHEIIQLWINTPKEHKSDAPEYYPVSKEELAKVNSDDDLVELNILSGELQGKVGPIPAKSKMVVANLYGSANGEIDIDLPSNYSTCIYLLEGEMQIGDKVVGDKTLVYFNNDGDAVALKFNSTSKAILLSGEPIEEPMATYGPFVMNTQSEIIEALNAYERGEMGRLVENFG